ncbi:probable LRR receptor-like serine/threonine-protein kinase At3g47570 [Asparagus officinalis]|uniref:probable LRR receptor-like serine/threonine-protein kinase At3g47570 n=1 Tax=Asparagus officinalis TaxID=4686 RepID=UPI00098E301F|nr:probable LRR receptor-like serine/threonine-protein kinase At3g47570 [Asparagus officinalis]
MVIIVSKSAGLFMLSISPREVSISFILYNLPSLASMETYQSVLLVTHLMLLLFTSSSAVKHNNITDLSALLAIRAQVIERDPSSVISANWTTDASFCTWMGVSCSRRWRRVTALNISNMPLYGTIPPHISNLSFLSLLSLSNDGLAGTIPESLARLPRLKYLGLDGNQLSGSIPPAFFNMSSLIELRLGHNSISGTLPSNDSNFHPLFPHIMAMSWNQLTGSIPSSLCGSRTLQFLSLSFNQLTGNIPSEIGNMKQLNTLYLGSNYLTGTIPSSLGNLTNLSKLSLGNSSFHGNIPEELGRLTSLDRLQISFCGGITGPIPISLSNLSSLTFFQLAKNSLTGPVRLQFGNMANLSILELLGNKLTGGVDFLASLSNCRVLDRVNIGENELDGILPYTVGNLSRTLTVLGIQDNHIKGKIPVELGNLSGLIALSLSNNELVGTIPSEIKTLQGLQSLSLDSNRIYGSIPHELGRLRNLVALYLNGNCLSGSIPDSLGNITGLEILRLGANRLSSTIPETIWSLTHLHELNLSQNLLTGSLPLTLWNMQGLYAFDVSINQLSGDLPSPPKYLEINYLDLSNNSFDGHIPESFGNLINLDVLKLSCNKLSGVIPESLVKIRHLSILNLSFNKLEGKVPNDGAFLNVSAVSLEGNAALCGAPRLGFSSCNPSDSKDSNSRRHLLRYILPVIASSGVLLLGFCILLRFCRRRAKNLAPPSMLSSTHHRLISYYELVRATDNFSEINLLGMGTSGSVYRGLLDDGLLVAIKVLNLEIEGASRSFDAECRALRLVRHRNLGRIISTCSNMDLKALVLQFMPNGSLERWLHSHNYCLSLLQRIDIIIDVASAIDYLHHHHSEVILHRDLKPSNILLDEEMVAHVSDFGIAKLLSGDNRSVTSASTAGTIGYIAPEYASTGRVSTKGDVYSFGILLLEIFTRKKPTDPMFTGESSLRRWVNDANPSGLLDIVDCNLLKDENGNERPKSYLISTQACLSSIMQLGIICSSDSPRERLAMKDVVPQLQKIKMRYMSESCAA